MEFAVYNTEENCFKAVLNFMRTIIENEDIDKIKEEIMGSWNNVLKEK